MALKPTVRAQLYVDEGTRAKPYRDSVGKLTIGVGRNLEDVGLRDDEIDLLLSNDIDQAIADARALISGHAWENMSEARQAAVVNMAFNLGRARLGGFRRMLAALECCDYSAAASEMKDSAWFGQVGRRAERLVRIMEAG